MKRLAVLPFSVYVKLEGLIAMLNAVKVSNFEQIDWTLSYALENENRGHCNFNLQQMSQFLSPYFSIHRYKFLFGGVILLFQIAN